MVHQHSDSLEATSVEGDIRASEIVEKKFQQGRQLAVFYDDSYYIGEVLKVLSEDEAEIAFMEQIRGQNLFRWGTEDVDKVHRKFVISWDISLTSRNGRTWSLTNFSHVQLANELYRKEYCT